MTEKVQTMQEAAELRTITVEQYRRKAYRADMWEIIEWHGHDSRRIPKTATIRRKLPDSIKNLPAEHCTIVPRLKLRDGKVVKLYRAKSPDWKTYVDAHLTYVIVNTAKYWSAAGNTVEMDKCKFMLDQCVKDYIACAGDDFRFYPHCVTDVDFYNWYADPEIAAQLPANADLWEDINTLMIQDADDNYVNDEQDFSAHYYAQYVIKYHGIKYGENAQEEYRGKYHSIVFPRTELKNIQLLIRAFAVNGLYFNPGTEWLMRDSLMWWYVQCDNGDMYLNDLSHGGGGQFTYVPVSRRPKPQEKTV